MSIFAQYAGDTGSLEPSVQYRAVALRLADERRRNGGACASSVLIRITGEVNSEMAAYVSDQLLFEAPCTEFLSLEINSRGGCASSAAFIYTVIRHHSAKRKEAYITGSCFSGALTIALAADVRIAHPSAKILLHPSRVEIQGTSTFWSSARLVEQAAVLQAVDAEIIALTAARTGADPAVIAREAATEDMADLSWCLDYGIIHEISERPHDA